MRSLYYYNPITVTNKLLRKDVITWSKLYRYLPLAVGICDRTETFKQPFRLAIADTCKLPTLTDKHISYTECGDRRAKELFELSERTGKKLKVFWSGGIDSTNIFVCFMRNYSIAQLKDKIEVVMNLKSVMENPNFYYKYILPNFKLTSSELTPWLFDDKSIVVTGELNDQLFGSDMMRSYLITEGPELMNGKFSRDVVFEYINRKIQDARMTNIMIDGILDSAKAYGVELEKNSDFLWWYNFCFKWQNVHYRIYVLTIPRLQAGITKEWDAQNMKHFYETDEFQLWSVNTPDARLIPEWRQYKMYAKRDIYDFNKDQDFFENKIKTGSFHNVYKHRVIAEAFTDTFEIVKDFDPHEFYEPDNIFNKI